MSARSLRSEDHYGRKSAPPLAEQLAGTFFAPATEPAPPVHRVPVSAHMRTISGPPPATGAERKDAAMLEHQRNEAKRAAIVHVRASLLTLYRTRLKDDPFASVNADDIDAILKAWPNFDPELRDGSQNWRGAIFAGKGWVRTGEWVPSTRPEMNSHLNPCWRPVL